jgi:hypothetical protein
MQEGTCQEEVRPLMVRLLLLLLVVGLNEGTEAVDAFSAVTCLRQQRA